MKLNQTLLLGAVAALGIVAAVLWGSRQTAAPKRPVASTKQAAAKPEAAPIAPPTPPPVAEQQVAGREGPLAQMGAVMPPEDVSALRAVVDSPEKLSAVIDAAVRAAGGEKLQQSYLSSVWQLTLTVPDRTMYLEAEVDVEGSLAIRDRQADIEWFVVQDKCRVRQFGFVQPCNIREIPDGFSAVMMAALPLRLKKVKFQPKDVGNSFDAVWLQLPSGPAVAKRLSIRREQGDIASDYNAVTAESEFRGMTRRYGTPPNRWLLATHRSPNSGDQKEAAPVQNWEASVRVRDVHPRDAKALIKPPEFTGPQPLSVYARPAIWVTSGLAPRGKIEDAGRAFGGLAWLDHVEFVRGERFTLNADGTLAPTSELIVQPPDGESYTLPQGITVQKIQAEPRVAHKFVNGTWDTVPVQLEKFIGEIKRAGHHVGTGMVFARYLHGDETGLGLVEFQVPLAAAPTP